MQPWLWIYLGGVCSGVGLCMFFGVGILLWLYYTDPTRAWKKAREKRERQNPPKPSHLSRPPGIVPPAEPESPYLRPKFRQPFSGAKP